MDFSLGTLGKQLQIEEVAHIFNRSTSTVRRRYVEFGGTKIGGAVVFFENLVSETVRTTYAAQVQEAREMDGAVARAGQVQGEKVPQAVPYENGGPGLGGPSKGGNRRPGKPNADKADAHSILT